MGSQPKEYRPLAPACIGQAQAGSFMLTARLSEGNRTAIAGTPALALSSKPKSQ